MRISLICFFCFYGVTSVSLTALTAGAEYETTSRFIYPEYSKRISMDFQNAPLVDVLKIFSQQSSLNLITSEDMANQRVTIYLENVPVEQALEQILRANNLTYEVKPDSDIYIVKPLNRPEVELVTRVYPLKHATVASSKLKHTLTIKDDDDAVEVDSDPALIGIVAVLRGIITAQGKIVEDPRTNSLIITDIASNFPHIENAVTRLDIPVPQILIEVEMLEVSTELSSKIGVKMGDTPLEFTGAQRSHLYPWDQNDILRRGPFQFEDEYFAGLIDAKGLKATLQLLRTHSDTKNLARPRILTLNNEAAQIKIATDEAIGIKTQTTSAEGVGSSSDEAERVETGVFLTVTPQANVPMDEITMAIVPKVIIARTGSTFEGRTFRDPEERGAKSILKVKSGETIIIGGLIRTDVTNTATRVPFFADIPFIGRAFRHKDEKTVERELIIFITPHILKDTPPPVKAASSYENASFLTREQDIPDKRLRSIEQEILAVENHHRQ
jgi:type II secretory pathway component GspD/PulD (secretin)